MDPHLLMLAEGGAGADEVRAIIRLREPDVAPPGVRLVARFGRIATCRLRRDDILDVHASERVESLKAPVLVEREGGVDLPGFPEALPERFVPNDARRPAGLTATGRGVVIGVIDWGCDVAHVNLRTREGRTRLLALWDQSAPPTERSPQPYGYGVVHAARDIDRALAVPDPYDALGYRPWDSDPGGFGCHGTHVLDTAAGSGIAGPSGVAPDADLVFVHLGGNHAESERSLGDSVTLLEGLDFIAKLAASRPWVVNLSMGGQGGPHDGSSAFEQALDELLVTAPGRAVVQSCGNYYGRDAHAAGQLRPGESRTLTWEVSGPALAPRELEIWYPGRDALVVEVRAPDGAGPTRAPLGARGEIVVAGRTVCELFHRARDPYNRDNHCMVYLDPAAPTGAWQVTLIGEDVVDGRWHAWIERESGCRECRNQLQHAEAVRLCTTNSICNGYYNIAVGAYNAHDTDFLLPSFTSAGPTRNDRVKPDLVAPGVWVLAARSASEGDTRHDATTRMSGSSMASPHVAGACALMMEAAGRPLAVNETRRLLFGAARKVTVRGEDEMRVGSGVLDVAAAVEAARNLSAAERVSMAMHPRESRPAGAMATSAVPNEETIMPASEHDMPSESEDDVRGLDVPLPDGDDAAEVLGDDAAGEAHHKLVVILLSGGPGPFATGDVRHDQSWANYVTPPLLLSKTDPALVASDDVDVRWLIYKPAYVARWADDSASTRDAQKRAVKEVKDKGFSDYVDLLEHRAREHHWTLVWLTKNDDFWADVKARRDGSISRVYYWGHGSGDLWLALRHTTDVPPIPVSPTADAIITQSSIDASLKKKFRAGSSERVHRFVACNTRDFAEAWASAYKVWTQGYDGSVQFKSTFATGGEPCLWSGATSEFFDRSGSSIAAPSTFRANVKKCSDIGAESVEKVRFAVAGAPGIEDESEPHEEYGGSPEEPGVSAPANAYRLPGAALVARAERVLHGEGGHVVRTPAEFLYAVLGPGETGEGSEVGAVAPAALFDAYANGHAESSPYDALFEVIGMPGDTPSATIDAGDVMIRRALGEPDVAHAAVIVAPPVRDATTGLSGRQVERGGRGYYAPVAEGGGSVHCAHAPYARRVLDAEGAVPRDTLLLRPARAGLSRSATRVDVLAENVPDLAVTVRNRLLHWLDPVATCDIRIEGTAVRATTGASGEASINLSGLADGHYHLVVEPASATRFPVGPQTAVPAAGTAAPTRVWRPVRTVIRVQGERITSIDDAHVSVAGRRLTVELQPAWIESPNQSTRSAAAVISLIVVHHTGGTTSGSAINTFLDTSVPVAQRRSIHYLVDVDGQVVKMVPEHRKAWHAGRSAWLGHDDVNEFSIGIEVVNDAGAYPVAQYDALLDLLRRIRGAHATIPANGIVGHSDIATLAATATKPRRLGRKHGDPGLEFEWKLIEAAGLGMSIRAGGPPAALFGGVFDRFPGIELRTGDHDGGAGIAAPVYGGAARHGMPTQTVIRDLQNDLIAIGYFCPLDGVFGEATEDALKMFQEHFCGGTRPRAAHAGEVDEYTAGVIKRVR